MEGLGASLDDADSTREVIEGLGSQFPPRLRVEKLERLPVRSIVVSKFRKSQLLFVVREEAIRRMLCSDEHDKFSETVHGI